MPPFLLLPLLAACSTTGVVVHRRVPQINILCADTGHDACTLSILAPWNRSASADLVAENPGTDTLIITSATLQNPYFSITPGLADLPPDGAQTFTVTYSPAGFEAVETTLVFETNAEGGAVSVDVRGVPDVDVDADDYVASEAGGDDCDDGNATIHPDAADACYDGVDSNCDGATDYDCDEDGYISDAHGGDDCEDADPDIHPDAVETWYDGIDANCAGENDWDADEDGYTTVDKPGGNDCDDTSPDVHPDASDPVGDGIDQDCDGADG